MADGAADHLAEQVGIEAERISGSVEDGVEAARTASESFGNLFLDAYARTARVLMRSGLDMGHHMLSLLGAKTPAEAYRMNYDFMQKQVSSLQTRFFEVAGVKQPAGRGDGTPAQRA